MTYEIFIMIWIGVTDLLLFKILYTLSKVNENICTAAQYYSEMEEKKYEFSSSSKECSK